MIWFNIKGLEKKIIENQFSDKDAFNYFLAFSILGVLTTYLSTTQNIIAFIELLLGIIITIWGSFSIFKANSTGDGQDFFKRYFALSWVIGFRLFVFTLIIGVPLLIIFAIISYDSFSSFESGAESLTEDFVSMIITSLVLLIYYLLLTNSFKRVSQRSN